LECPIIDLAWKFAKVDFVTPKLENNLWVRISIRLV
jgi:hypothetical protein